MWICKSFYWHCDEKWYEPFIILNVGCYSFRDISNKFYLPSVYISSDKNQESSQSDKCQKPTFYSIRKMINIHCPSFFYLNYETKIEKKPNCLYR